MRGAFVSWTDSSGMYKDKKKWTHKGDSWCSYVESLSGYASYKHEGKEISYEFRHIKNDPVKVKVKSELIYKH